ncbi:MAG: YggS family pyridoxal phosphate-dependent enzyme [Thermodesulfovibrionia bacterium]|nr:YggS family pyridoxal phosphate-dependent enzyme [Thermodesulfovibrionia bacterium]MCK5287077.1 YggS family pyridoxal phosphate-dependent enzyme [Thermodesulfovibrionia bacterium]
MGIAEAFKAVQARINSSALKAGRSPDSIKLVAVSKTIALQKIIEAVNAGVSIVGENKVQEAREKITELRERNTDLNIEWHLIGNLQKNKAKTAVHLFDVIHSLDSLSLAEELNKYSQRFNKRQRVLIQVKLSDEPTKYGVMEKYLMALLERLARMENLRPEGLMTMPPFYEDPEKTRPYFKNLREISVKTCEKGFPLKELSMGMSHDFEVAIEEGATMVRIGTAIFGERQVKK